MYDQKVRVGEGGSENLNSWGGFSGPFLGGIKGERHSTEGNLISTASHKNPKKEVPSLSLNLAQH